MRLIVSLSWSKEQVEEWRKPVASQEETPRRRWAALAE